jgi:DNA-binding NtrC family response regulator
MTNILIIDDEPSIRKAIAISLGEDGYKVKEAGSKSEALTILRNNEFDLLVLDLFVPSESEGLEILRAWKEKHPEDLVIIITAHGSTERTVAAIKAGADDFLEKGFTMEELKFRLGKLLEQRRLNQENIRLKENYHLLRREVESRYRFEHIVGNSRAIRDLLELLSKVVDDPGSTVLLQGESGTGKELAARAIHYNGPRKDKPFIVVNCAALPEHLLESELFGYEKGAFTGAIRDKAGKFEIADGGTLFLDEVAETNPGVQAKLLRFTQDHTYERVGGNRLIKVDVRIIAATNKQLEAEVKQGRFREDLFYRLNVIPIQIPSLRERREDIPILTEHLIKKYANAKGRTIRISPETMNRLINYHWPGNIRELENLVERLIVTAQQEIILPADLPHEISGHSEKQSFEEALQQSSLKEASQEFERLFLLHHLEKHRWNISEVARVLGERRDTLSKKIKRFGLKEE